MLPVIGFFAVVLVVGFGIVTLLFNRPPIEEVLLPTASPTSGCTIETVQVWWGIQDVALETFVKDASSASRTMPGERLNTHLTSLKAFLTSFPSAPDCISTDAQKHLTDLLTAMDETIALLSQWANETIDGATLSNAFYDLEVRIRLARVGGRG